MKQSFISVFYWIFQFGIRFLFLFYYGLMCAKASKTDSSKKASFKKASFSSEGVSLSKVKTSSVHLNSELYGSIEKLFFSFDAYYVVFEGVELQAKYLKNWLLKVRLIKVLDKNTFELIDLSCENDKGAFLCMRKFSNVGQYSVLNLDIGYNDLVGWRWQSKQVIMRDQDIFFLGNYFFLGRIKTKVPNYKTSLKPISGFINGISIGSDYTDSLQLKGVGYYYLQSKEDFDFTFTPFFYLKDIGCNLEFRDLKHDFEFNLYSEQIIKSMRYFDTVIEKPNHIFSFKSNNKWLKADIVFFNASLFNQITWKEMLYEDFSCLNRDYFGYLCLDTEFLKVNFIQKNDQNSALLEVGLLPYLFLEIKRDVEEKKSLSVASHIPCFFNFGLVLLDFDWQLRCLLVEDGSSFHDLNWDVMTHSACLKFDLPMLFFQDFMLRSEVFVKTEGGILDSIKNVLNKLNISTCSKPENIVVKNIGGSITLENMHSSMTFSFQNTKNFDFSFVSPFKGVDLLSFEVRDSRWLVGVFVLKSDFSYGLKIGEDQFIGQLVYDLNDAIKLKFLGGYEFKETFWTFENFKSQNTYFFIGLDLKTNAWQLEIQFGLKNIRETKKGTPFLNGAISMIPWIQLEEFEQIFEDIKREKKEILALQDEFK